MESSAYIFHKFNYDASFTINSNLASFGAIICNDFSNFVAVKVRVIRTTAIALLDATQWPKQLQFCNIIFEGDSKPVVQAINDVNMHVNWDVRAILSDCPVMLSNLQN